MNSNKKTLSKINQRGGLDDTSGKGAQQFPYRQYNSSGKKGKPSSSAWSNEQTLKKFANFEDIKTPPIQDNQLLKEGIYSPGLSMNADSFNAQPFSRSMIQSVGQNSNDSNMEINSHTYRNEGNPKTNCISNFTQNVHSNNGQNIQPQYNGPSSDPCPNEEQGTGCNRSNSARLQDLCAEDKKKIGELIKKLANEKEEKDKYKKQVEEDHIKHQKELRSVFQQNKLLLSDSQQISTKYQEHLNKIKFLDAQSSIPGMLTTDQMTLNVLIEKENANHSNLFPSQTVNVSQDSQKDTPKQQRIPIPKPPPHNIKLKENLKEEQTIEEMKKVSKVNNTKQSESNSSSEDEEEMEIAMKWRTLQKSRDNSLDNKFTQQKGLNLNSSLGNKFTQQKNLNLNTSKQINENSKSEQDSSQKEPPYSKTNISPTIGSNNNIPSNQILSNKIQIHNNGTLLAPKNILSAVNSNWNESIKTQQINLTQLERGREQINMVKEVDDTKYIQQKEEDNTKRNQQKKEVDNVKSIQQHDSNSMNVNDLDVDQIKQLNSYLLRKLKQLDYDQQNESHPNQKQKTDKKLCQNKKETIKLMGKYQFDDDEEDTQMDKPAKLPLQQIKNASEENVKRQLNTKQFSEEDSEINQQKHQENINEKYALNSSESISSEEEYANNINQELEQNQKYKQKSNKKNAFKNQQLSNQNTYELDDSNMDNSSLYKTQVQRNEKSFIQSCLSTPFPEKMNIEPDFLQSINTIQRQMSEEKKKQSSQQNNMKYEIEQAINEIDEEEAKELMIELLQHKIMKSSQNQMHNNQNCSQNKMYNNQNCSQNQMYNSQNHMEDNNENDQIYKTKSNTNKKNHSSRDIGSNFGSNIDNNNTFLRQNQKIQQNTYSKKTILDEEDENMIYLLNNNFNNDHLYKMVQNIEQDDYRRVKTHSNSHFYSDNKQNY